MCFLFSILDQNDQVLSQEEDTSSNNLNSPRFTQLTSQTTGLNSKKLDIYVSSNVSQQFVRYIINLILLFCEHKLKTRS